MPNPSFTMSNSNVQTKHKQAYNFLKQKIINDEIVPGTILVERDLCQKMNVSRTPLRSAMQELAQEGFLAAAPGRGMMVAPVQIEDVIELFEIRMELDPLALRLFMDKNVPELVEDMRHTIEGMEETIDTDYERFAVYDSNFHEIYQENTGNGRLYRMLFELREQQQRITHSVMNDAQRKQRSLEEHKRIMDAIESRDTELACNALRSHLQTSVEYHLKKMMRQ